MGESIYRSKIIGLYGKLFDTVIAKTSENATEILSKRVVIESI